MIKFYLLFKLKLTIMSNLGQVRYYEKFLY